MKLQKKFYITFLLRTIVATLFVFFGLYSALIILSYVNQQIVGNNNLMTVYLLLFEILIFLLTIYKLKTEIENTYSIIRCELLYWISLFITTAVLACYTSLAFIVRIKYNYIYLLYNVNFNIWLVMIANIILIYTATVIAGIILFLYFQVIFPLSNKLKNKWLTMGIVYGTISIAYLSYGLHTFDLGNMYQRDKIIYSILTYIATIITLHYVADYFEENVYTADLEDEAVIIVQSNRIIYHILFLPIFIVRKYSLALRGYLFQK